MSRVTSGDWTVCRADSMQNMCGMSVVGGDYDKLKRYNLSELASSGQNAT